MQKCNFSHCTVGLVTVFLSCLFGSVGATSTVVNLVTAHVYYCYGNCVILTFTKFC